MKLFSFKECILTGIIIFFVVPIEAQGIINSSGYIKTSGAPYITLYNSSLDNSGTWTKATETVTFTGSAATELKGSTSSLANLVMSNISATGTTLNTTNVISCDNLTISALGTLTIAPTSKLTVGTTITNNRGNAGLVIKSTANGSGSLISTSSVAATVEQYHTDSSYVYHMVSSPVTSATAAVFKFNGVQTYVYSYNPATPAWVNVTSSSTLLNVGEGYLVNYHNVAIDRTSIYAGSLNASAISPTISATASRFNLIGNPFPCAIDWDGSGWTRSNISTTYYLWLPAKGSYGTYATGVPVNGLGHIIPSGQSFFVYSTGSSPTLTIGTAAKTHNNSILKSAKILPPMIKLHVSNNANSFSDEAVVIFSPSASAGYDDGLDAIKIFTLSTESSQIYTSVENKDLVINAMPLAYKDSIPIFFKCKKGATYTLELNENTWTDSIFLTDLIENKTISLTLGKYVFNATTTDTSRRFVLNRKKSGSSATAVYSMLTGSDDVKIFSDGRYIYLLNNTGKEFIGDLAITGIDGRQIYLEKNVWLVTEMVRKIPMAGLFVVTFKGKTQYFKAKVVIF